MLLLWAGYYQRKSNDEKLERHMGITRTLENGPMGAGEMALREYVSIDIKLGKMVNILLFIAFMLGVLVFKTVNF